MNFKERLKRKTEERHTAFHTSFGILAAVAVSYLFPEAKFSNLLLVGVLGSILPDIDHIFFLFLYGKGTEYAKEAKKYIKSKELKKFIAYVKKNHKKNLAVYSHNIISVIVVTLLSIKFLYYNEHAYWAVFFLSWSFHYMFDILEDALYFGKINPNWFLKFSKQSEDLEDID